MNVESTITTTSLKEIEVASGVFVKFTKTVREDKASISGDVYKRIETKGEDEENAKTSETNAGYISYLDNNLSCRINTSVLSDAEAASVFAKVAGWKQDILES